MRHFIKTLGNAAFVIGGFFVVFFGLGARMGQQDGEMSAGLPASGADIAHADAPYSQSSYYDQASYYGQGTYYGEGSYYSEGSYTGSGDSGSGK